MKKATYYIISDQCVILHTSKKLSGQIWDQGVFNLKVFQLVMLNTMPIFPKTFFRAQFPGGVLQ